VEIFENFCFIKALSSFLAAFRAVDETISAGLRPSSGTFPDIQVVLKVLVTGRDDETQVNAIPFSSDFLDRTISILKGLNRGSFLASKQKYLEQCLQRQPVLSWIDWG